MAQEVFKNTDLAISVLDKGVWVVETTDMITIVHVAGFSMGGGGTTAYGKKHSELFSAVYVMSALMNIPEQGATPTQRPDDKMAILTKLVQENNCIRYVEDADEAARKQLKTVAWHVDCSDDDFLLDCNIEFT
jgi:pimeloyl-ACP methyl ester carboxylesterase